MAGRGAARRGGERPCQHGLHRRLSGERPSGGPNPKQQSTAPTNRPLPATAGPLPFITSPPPRAHASFRRGPLLPGCLAAPRRARLSGCAHLGERARPAGRGGAEATLPPATLRGRAAPCAAASAFRRRFVTPRSVSARGWGQWAGRGVAAGRRRRRGSALRRSSRRTRPK